jgi:hypothetical protein
MLSMLTAPMEWSTSATQPTVLVLFMIVVVGTIQRLRRNRIERKGYALPPGPISFPLLGSVLSISTKEPWLTYTKWRAKYGECGAKLE